MSANAAKAGEAFVEVSLRSKISAGAKRVQKDLRAVATSLRTTGGGLQAAGATVAAPLIAGLVGVGTVFGQFSHKMSEVSAITGATGENFDKLNAKAKELGSSTQFSASEAAEAMKFLGMAGYNTEQILAGIGPTLQLAAAGGLELAMAADIASDVSSAFGLAADDIGLVADVLAKTATSSNTSVEMMGEAFRYAAPLAAAAGQSIEETSAALGTLANSGIKATVAGTDVAGILKSMGDQADKLDALGIAIADAEGNARSITDVMRDFGAATQSMTQVERLQAANDIFGRYAKSALVLSSNIPALVDLKAKLDAAEGSAGEMAKIMQNDLWGSFKSLTSAAEGLIIAIGGGADGMMRSIMDTLSSALRATTQFLEANKGVATAIAAVAIAAAGAGVAVFALGTGLVFAGAVAAAISALMTPVAGIVALVTAAVIASAAQWAVLAGVFLYVLDQAGLLMPIFSFLQAKLVEVLGTVKEAFGGITDALSAGEYMLAAQILMQGLKIIFMQGINALYQAFANLWNNAGSLTWRFLVSFGKMIHRVFRSIPKILWSALRGGADIVEILGAAITQGLDTNGQIFDVDAAQADLQKLRQIAKQRAARSRAASAGSAAQQREQRGPASPPGQPTLQPPQRPPVPPRRPSLPPPPQPDFAAIARQSQEQLAATRAAAPPGLQNPGKQAAFSTAGLEKIAMQQLAFLGTIARRQPIVIQEARI